MILLTDNLATSLLWSLKNIVCIAANPGCSLTLESPP